MDTIHHLIDGTSVTGSSDRTSPVFNPATGQQTAELSLATVDEVDTLELLRHVGGTLSGRAIGTTGESK